MKFKIIIILCLLLSFCTPIAADFNMFFYSQQLNNPEVDKMTKLQYVDSLLAHKPENYDSLLTVKIRLAYETDNYDLVIDTYKLLGKGIEKFELPQNCRIRLDYIQSLIQKKQYVVSMASCSEFLKLQKPDSMIYYDALIYALIYDFSRQTNIPFREDYIMKVEEILKNSQQKNLTPYAIGRIKRSLHTMKLKKAIYNKDYDKALKESDELLKIPMSDTERISLDSNIAFIYMLIGQYEAAEQIFQKVLRTPKSQYNKGICLMNYTHMLNLQGRYDETIAIIEKHKSAAESLNQDIYYSHLLANRAIAESNTVGYEKAFNTLLRNKELEDSLYFYSSIQDGLLLFDFTEKSENLTELGDNYSRQKNITLALSIILAIMTIATAFTIWSLRKSRKEKKSLNEKLEQSEKLRTDNDRLLSDITEKESAKTAASLLQLAKIEETISSIGEIANTKNKTPEEKLKLISETLSGAHRERDIREIFEQQFEQAHSQFFKKLYNAHPDLTPGEARMCAYIIMNLSTKEIASLTSKTIRSVESTRYRIGKKLAITEGKTVISYLREFI